MSATNARFDEQNYQAALAFYGLPENYRRTFSKTEKGQLIACPPQLAAKRAWLTWLQINQPKETYPIKKAADKDITVYKNFTLDFELPAKPLLAHVVGLQLVHWLVAELFADDYAYRKKDYLSYQLPIVDSGAGCHIVVPLEPIITNELPPEQRNLLSKAVQRVRKDHIEPIFRDILIDFGLPDDKIKLEASDISRLLSVPGTWRPGHSKSSEIDYLTNGYLRRWLPPYDPPLRLLPQRIESKMLTRLILEKAAELANEQQERNIKIYSLPTSSLQSLPHPDKKRITNVHNYVKSAIREETTRVMLARTGDGNDTLFKAAINLGQLVGTGLLDRVTVENHLENAATIGNRRSVQEARSTIRSGLERGVREPRALTW